MSNRIRTCGLGTLLALSSLFVRAAIGQDTLSRSEAIPLIVQAGVPLHVVLEKKVPIKLVGAPVEGHTVEPIYVFDHMVIPAGTRIVGRVSKVEGLSRKRRALTIANSDFTPYRKAYLDF